ncbi:hypothetical protein T4D_8872, partial [Trichinella pseudospiralis]
MADIAELRLVTNRRGGTSFVYEGRSYKLKYRQTGENGGYSKDKERVQRWTKHQPGCNSGAEADFPQQKLSEAAAANAEPPTSGQFLFFREVRSAMYKQRANRFPRLPRDRQDLVLAPEFTRT